MDYHNSSLNQPKQQVKAEPVKPVVKGKTSIKKKGFFRQMADDLIVTDGKTVWQSVRDNVIIPGMKKIILDIIWNSATTALYNTRPTSTPSMNTYSNPSYMNTSAPSIYYNNQRQQPQQMSPQSGNVYNDILFDDSGDAQAVLNEMQQRVEAYGNVSVADMYSMAGMDIPQGNWILDRWRWTSLLGSSVVPVPSGGYILNLPQPRYF